jgi:hypothetical protein
MRSAATRKLKERGPKDGFRGNKASPSWGGDIAAHRGRFGVTPAAQASSPRRNASSVTHLVISASLFGSMR